MRKALITSFALAAALLVAATASGGSTASSAAAGIPGCNKATLNLLAPGTLTIGADNPAYPPWFGGDEKTKPWKISDPYSGKGYEAGVAYAIAQQLGFSKAQVKWTVVPFNNSYRPGKKPFDLYLTQVSYKPARAKAADFSKSYYFVNQTLVALKNKPIASAKSIAALKDYKLGAQIGTTGAFEIKKVEGLELKTYDEIGLAFEDMAAGRLAGVVCDEPTAANFALQRAEYKVKFQIVGEPFTKEFYGVVVKKGNKELLERVNKGIRAVQTKKADEQLRKKWLR